jgi:hypothetical protein
MSFHDKAVLESSGAQPSIVMTAPCGCSGTTTRPSDAPEAAGLGERAVEALSGHLTGQEPHRRPERTRSAPRSAFQAGSPPVHGQLRLRSTFHQSPGIQASQRRQTVRRQEALDRARPLASAPAAVPCGRSTYRRAPAAVRAVHRRDGRQRALANNSLRRPEAPAKPAQFRLVPVRPSCVSRCSRVSKAASAVASAAGWSQISTIIVTSLAASRRCPEAAAATSHTRASRARHVLRRTHQHRRAVTAEG